MIRRELESFLAAVRFFTRLPVPAWVGHSAAGLPAAIRWFPAVGALIGSLAALVYLLAAQVWPAQVALLLSMASSIYLTGAFHEDGLSDTVDGLGGGWDKERILAIMKDSRLGNYGAIALWLALSGKFALLAAQPAALLPAILLAGHTLSRACAASLLAALDYAREAVSRDAVAWSFSTQIQTVHSVPMRRFSLPGALGLTVARLPDGVMPGAMQDQDARRAFPRWQEEARAKAGLR